MKKSLLLAGLLSVSALFATEAGTVNVGLYENSQADLRASREETSNAKIMTNEAKAQTVKVQAKADSAKEELAKANAIIDQQNEDIAKVTEKNNNLSNGQKMYISVTGQGVAPMNTSSPAQAYALAKRAAIADAYRAIAEKVKGVRIDGQDLIKNMMVKRSTIRTSVNAMVKNANVVETTFKEGLCEVEMEIVIFRSDFPQ